MSTEFHYNIRAACKDDVGSILRLIKELADYEKEPHEVTVTEEILLRDGFGERPLFHVIVAETDQVQSSEEDALGSGNKFIFGFAMYFWSYSSWKGKFLYLEDLYVCPDYRRHGVGKALMVRIGQIAEQEDCVRMQWVVLDWNTPSKAFYENFVGASCLSDWQLYRVTQDGIREFLRKRGPQSTHE
eukprot:TRINITY_DN5560_c0_g1_i1.p1 TRINITY_DN5560_c0_g1~~TRINITY_DN5560_c0_g1_i1.p1  ORF type:complete len:186 (-),score=42.63 TRINITY_DN5560_c0_g1_i1:107-664(-)